MNFSKLITILIVTFKVTSIVLENTFTVIMLAYLDHTRTHPSIVDILYSHSTFVHREKKRSPQALLNMTNFAKQCDVRNRTIAASSISLGENKTRISDRRKYWTTDYRIEVPELVHLWDERSILLNNLTKLKV